MKSKYAKIKSDFLQLIEERIIKRLLKRNFQKLYQCSPRTYNRLQAPFTTRQLKFLLAGLKYYDGKRMPPGPQGKDENIKENFISFSIIVFNMMKPLIETFIIKLLYLLELMYPENCSHLFV